MYFGHYAVAAAMRARKPTLPLVPILVGVGVLDILHGLFVLAGLEKVTPVYSRLEMAGGKEHPGSGGSR